MGYGAVKGTEGQTQMFTVRRYVAAAMTACILLPAPASADADLADGLADVRAKRWDDARAAMDQIAEPALRDVVEWHVLRGRRGTFAEAVSFLDRNPDWPGLGLVRAAAERSMPVALPPADVVSFFDGQPPETPEGALRLAIALRSMGRNAEAETVAIEAWLTLPIAAAAHAGFLEVFGDVLEPFHAARLDALIWAGDVRSAERTLPMIEGDEAALARARIALRDGRPGVDGLIAAVPEGMRDHQGLSYERFRWRLGKGRRDGEDGALALLFAHDESADTLGAPEAWAPHRERLARDLMQDGRIADAYRVAARHHLPDGDKAMAGAEWLAGYIAYRFMDDPAQAADHFARFDRAVASPISKGRAGYWLGRALETAGDAAGAQAAYAAGGRYQTSFYGQLAAERAGLPTDPRLAGTEAFPALADTALADSTALAAAEGLAEIGERDLAERFATHLAEILPRDEVGTLIDDVLSWDEPHIALKVAKRAAQRGLEMHRGYFPVTDLAERATPVPPEMTLSIARRESEFDPVVVSHAGARGLMQLMPGTAREMAGVLGMTYAPRRLTTDPSYNAALGTAYLAELEGEFGPSPVLVPAAYNAGPSRARRWSARFGDPSDPSVDVVHWIEDVPFSETRNYIMRVSESLLPYHARLTGDPGPVRLTQWLRRGYGDLAPGETKATRGE